MNHQYIHDNNGNATGIYIPIEEWQLLKQKYKGLEQEELNGFDIPEKHKEIIDERLNDYRNNPSTNLNFDEMIMDIREKYAL